MDNLMSDIACQQVIESSREIANRIDDMVREITSPFVLMKPHISKDGNMWCALYGDNLQDGVCGFGDTPAKAAEAFNAEWYGAQQ